MLIGIGSLGLVLLLSFLALRLLAAATETLVYLLLAPALVLAPAFGWTGRSLFTRWLSKLLCASLSKLLFAFLLGVVFTVSAALVELQGLGWWTQWLLLSAFWWSAFLKRGQVLAPLGTRRPERRRHGRLMNRVVPGGRGLALSRAFTAGHRPAPETPPLDEIPAAVPMSDGPPVAREQPVVAPDPERGGQMPSETVTKTKPPVPRAATTQRLRAPELESMLRLLGEDISDKKGT